MDWKQELIGRLDALAAKIGTTGAHLWEVLVRQSIITGYADLGTAVILAATCATLAYFARKFWLAFEKHDHGGGLAGSAVSYIAAVICGIVAIVSVYNAVLELSNPEYFALSEILKAVK